jgi:exosortase A-associated hydrolase 1
MRQMIGIEMGGTRLAATLNDGPRETGLLLVSGGNEIRSGAHGGQAAIAAHIASLGYPVLRYDRRGIGESEGENGGFETSGPDIAAALAAFRAAAPHVSRIVAFGNCDAASGLALFHDGLGIDHLLLANPWVIELAEASEDAPTPPSAAAIRARYWARIKNPRSLIDLFTGKINLKKLAGGLKAASQKAAPSGLSARIAAALAASDTPTTILLAARDTTAMAFDGDWKGDGFAPARSRADINVERIDSTSHSFADDKARGWLIGQLAAALTTP